MAKQSHDNQQRVISAWKAPLPPPELLAQYNQGIPNGAERVLKMIEDEQAHRINYEKVFQMVLNVF
jgi:uncharacterized membrane protein